MTKDSIRVREAVVNPNNWPPASVFDVPPFDRSLAVNPSDWMQGQSLDVTEIDQVTYDRINEKYGTNVEMRMKKFFEQMKAEED